MIRQELLNQIKAARRVSTPLIAISTPDPAATIDSLCETLNGDAPQLVWDIVNGLGFRNDMGKNARSALLGEMGDETIGNPVTLMTKALSLPPKSILFMHMASRWIREFITLTQAIWNLRDEFKVNQRMLIMLSSSIDLPVELQGDVIAFDEPLPDVSALREIVDQQFMNADLQTPEDSIIEKAIEAVQGLPAFQVEQIVAMSLNRKGLDIDGLWERKRRQIELAPGLKVFRDAVTFDSIGGVASIKEFLAKILHGQARPNAIVFVDEIEKMMAGSSAGGGGGGDTSGVSQDQLGTLLSYMQDQNAAGMIFVGPPGSAKSMVAKAAGNVGGVPTIQIDLGAMKGSLVGQSEQQLRTALKVITSVSNGRSLWIATCNSIGDLPPELRRRFTLGTFFFDLPDQSERRAIWEIHAKAYGHKIHALPNDDGWTGAEIRQCCDIAWRLRCSLKDAAQFVVPVSRSAKEKIENLQRAAEGRFLSASYAGVYDRNRVSADESPNAKSKNNGTGAVRRIRTVIPE